MEQTDRRSIFLLGVAHFFVDFACTALLRMLHAQLTYAQVIACAILYNGLAFAFQLPIGALGDLLKQTRLFSAVGCLLVALGSLFSNPWLLCLCIGLGNACFHVGGGREALKRGRGSAGPVGKFVAPGAIGIFLGPRLSHLFWVGHIVLPLCLVVLAGILTLSRKRGSQAEALSLPSQTGSFLRMAGLIVCMFLTVLLRSYMGTVLRYSFMSKGLLAFLFTLSIFFGKFFGGILADRFGTLRFCAWAQLLGAVLFTLSPLWEILAYPSIFLFNTTMAITATELYRSLPQFPGATFGLTTFALFLGVLPRLLGWENLFFNWWGLGLLSFLSAALLLGGLILKAGGGKDAQISGAVFGADAAP